jgi:outer membrane lipoprotein-sorting protein
MKTLLRLCLLVLLTSSFTQAIAQTSSMLYSNSRNYTFNFSSSNQQGSPEITRYFIEALAQAANRARRPCGQAALV